MSKVKQNKLFKNYTVSIIEGDVIESFPVLDIDHKDLEYVNGILPLSDSVKYVDQVNGGIHYFYNLDIPGKVEANSLRELRRSQAIKNIFSYDIDKTFDIFKFMPYIIIVLLVLFK